jgi:cell volume regulation protein A
MEFSFSNLLLIGSILLVLSVLLSKTTKYGVPAVILFIAVGMLAGVDGPGGIDFYNIQISKFIGTVALVLILFSGGLDTRYTDIRPIAKRGLLLSTLGVAITAILTGVFISYATELTIVEGLLLGSIISSTDAAAVYSILRSKNMGLKNNIRPLLEFESGSNDPMAYLLTIVFIMLLKKPDSSVISYVLFFIQQFTLGGIVGVAMGFSILKVMNRINLSFDGLYAVLLLGLSILTFGLAELVGGNGFLAVYVAAIILGNNEFIHKRSLIKHFDGQAWLMQIIMFLTLGLLVNPSELLPLAGIGLLFSVFIILVARPVAVFICLAGSQFSTRSKVFISWVGLRGAVPIILSIYALDAGVEKGRLIFNLVFFISFTSVLVKGITIPAFAKFLGLSVPIHIRKKSTLDIELANKVKKIVLEIDVTTEFRCVGKHLVELDLPDGITISMVHRGGNVFTPDGFTMLLAGDKLTVLADSVSSLKDFNRKIGTT